MIKRGGRSMKKKILFFIPTLMHGGAEKVLVNLVNYLDKEKYDITLQTLFDCGINKKFLKTDIKYRSNFKHLIRGNTKLMLLFSPEFLYKKLVRYEYDIIVSFLEGPTARILSGCPYNGTKKIAWIHIEQHTKKVFAKCFRTFNEAINVYNSFDKIICVSKTVKKDFERISQINDKTLVLYNVNDTEKIIEKSKEIITDYEFQLDIPTFCSVAKITKTKGYDRLARVHKRLIDEGIKHNIIIIGKGEDEKKINLYCKENGIEKTFKLIGFKENPYKYVVKCDGYICSSLREGFSTAVTEALILGIPCISTNCSGAYELLGTENKYGIVVDNDEESLYKGLKRLLISSDLLKKYKNMAIIRGKYFSTSKTIEAVEDMLAEVLQ